jgi:hypothetical protein
MHGVSRRLVGALSAMAAAVGVLALPVASAGAATTSSCNITWGSLPKSSNVATVPSDFITNVRAGRHTCYDRMVVDIGEAGGFNSYDVRYVDSVRAEGSGNAVPLRGAGDLAVVVRAPAYDEYGSTLYAPHPCELVDVSGYSTFRQIAFAGSYEGQTTFGLGVRARLPFRVFTLAGPSAGSGQDTRVVIDVAHAW